MSTFKLITTRTLNDKYISDAHANDIDVYQHDLISTTVHDEQLLRRAVEELKTKHASVIFTSKNAVTSVVAVMDDENFQRYPWTIYCLGGATRDAVIQHFGEDKITTTAPNGHTLASLIIQQQPPAEFVFFCSSRRNDDLPLLMRECGFQLREIVAYETRLTPVKVNVEPDAVAFFSPSAVESFFSLNALAPDVVCFAIGETTLAAIRRSTANRVICASAPSEAQLMDAVISYKKNQDDLQAKTNNETNNKK